MLGMPGDTLEGFKRTIDYIVRLAERPGLHRIRHARVHWTIIPPGSHFARHADEFGIRYHKGGVPYVLGTSTFPEGDLRRALEAIVTHPRADLFVWEDAEPLRILGGAMPAMLAPGGGLVGGPVPKHIDDAEVLRAISPLVPGRPLRQAGWTVGGIEREHGFPVVVLRGPSDRRVRLQLRPAGSDPTPRARTRSFDLRAFGHEDDVEAAKLVDALVALVAKNDGPERRGDARG
jgi:hypothetical protein